MVFICSLWTMEREAYLVVLISLWMTIANSSASRETEANLQPNIVVVLIDDLDVISGGLEPMAITRRLVGQHGALFTNAFVSTPVCCPSRSSILTGKYVHNHGVINNTVTGNCSSRHWQNEHENRTMAAYLQANGYSTFYGGKYLNQYGKNETGGVEHVPAGYNRWVGLVGNARYYNYTLSVDGERRNHGDDYDVDYLTDVLAREALDFVRGAVSNGTGSRPFFAMIAPPACHSPFTPAPQFANKFSGRKAPRPPNFNRHPGPDKHWLVRQAPPGPLPQDIVDRVDHVFRQRWRTLLSVDRMISRIVKLLAKSGQLDRTWLVVTSDHGFHMGQFAMPIDKRLPYETDIRVPLLFLAPTSGSSSNQISAAGVTIDSLAVVSIDLAPTILHMAGIDIPDDMDGVSLLPLITSTMWPTSDVSCLKEDEASGGVGPWYSSQINEPWRTSFLIEYHGEADLEDVDPQCQQDPNTTLCLNDYGCKCQDAANNTFVCLRTLSAPHATSMNEAEEEGEDSLYCQFYDDEHFVEFYDLRLDPYQMKNRAYRSDDRPCARSADHHRLLVDYTKCRGHVNCFRRR